VKPRVGLAGAGRVKDPSGAGKATTTATATQKASTLGGKGKAAAVATGGTAAVSGTAATAVAEEAKPEQEVKAEDEREVLVEGGQGISIEVSSEELQDAPEEHHEEYAEVPLSDVGSHEEGRSAPASPPIEEQELHYVEGSIHEDEVSPPPVSGSDHEHEHQGEEEHGSPQLSEEQREELLKDDVPALPTPSENEIVEAAAHPGAEEHLEKVMPPYQPSILPTGEQVDEEKREVVEAIANDT